MNKTELRDSAWAAYEAVSDPAYAAYQARLAEIEDTGR